MVILSCSVLAQGKKEVQVPKEIIEQIKRDPNLKDAIELDANGKALNLVASKLAISRTGTPVLYVHGINSICGAANCVTWLFRKSGKRYEMILDAGSVQQLIPQKSFTKGYRDIMSSKHGSAFESYLILHKFDGKQYRPSTCFFSTGEYEEDQQGNFRKWKKPIITRTKCDQKI